jgi:hypothetical protein
MRVREEIARLEKEQEQNRQDEQERKGLEQKQNQKQIEERELSNTGKPLPQPRQLNVASFILAPQLRSGNQLPTLSVPAQIDSVAMQLELEADDFAFYRVRLQNQSDGKTLWQSGRLKSRVRGEDQFLSVRFPAELLRSQIYTFEVSGVRADGSAEIIGNYSFQIMR